MAKPGTQVATEAERLRELEERVDKLEGILRKLTSDQALGNVLKGPFRRPGQAFQ